jgi:hypothetical protein
MLHSLPTGKAFLQTMSSSTGVETIAETEAVQQKSLPLGILNALDESVDHPAPWIIEKLLAEGEQMLVFGAPKVGKSQFALQMACCLAMGEPFLGWPISKKKRVLYLNFEMGKRIFMRRIAQHVSRLIAEKEKRECEESGNEYIGEDNPWHSLGEDVPLGTELREKVNETISDHLFFCGDFKSLEGDHVPKPPDSQKKAQGSTLKSSANEAGQEPLIRHWQSVIQEIKPDLVIFDTLSKTHSVNESDNSEIQRVLMRIREICQMPVPAVATEGNDATDATVSKAGEGKHIAHLIVHHARKSSPDSKKQGGNRMDLDSIRGGSAIRAEADVICGIMFANNKPTATHWGANRHLVVEARNLAPFDQPLNFEEFAFCHPSQRTPEEVEAERDAERNKENKLDQFILGLVRDAFVQSGMRGLKISTLETKVRTGLEKNKPKQALSDRGLKRKLESLANQTTSPFEVRIKKGLEEETAKFPHERAHGPKMYWIKEGSSWLEDEPLRTAIKSHLPYAVRKSQKDRDHKAGTGG